MRDITELPHDLFLIVIAYLSPRTCVRCRAVSRRWHAAFTSEVVSLLLLRWNFPRCRELRLAAAAAALAPASASLPRNFAAELRDAAEQPQHWASIFAEVACRYYHLNQGRPRIKEKFDLAVSSREGGPGFSFYPVAPWNRYLRLNERTSNFHYPDPVWWYSQEDGVLVYPATDDDVQPSGSEGHVYCVVDLSTGEQVPVPFDVREKRIRRVRLAQGVLIFEWAEALPYHQLNDREFVHRHFVTAFDVIRSPAATTSGPTWAVEFRSEWKLHFLGLPLNRSDRFFSAHTATHYAVYFWQPNRSLYNDDPIEQLAVWDISSPSPYRPSEEAPRSDKRLAGSRTPSLPAGLWSGQNTPVAGKTHGLDDLSTDTERPRRTSLAEATAGPQVIRRMAWHELDFYGLRQRATPQLRCLALDAHSLYVIEEEHRWADGQHSSLSPPRVHLVRSTGIPIVPLATSPVQKTGMAAPSLSAIIDGPVYGPVWVDSCGADGDVNMNFCRRVRGPPDAVSNADRLEHGHPPPPPRPSTSTAAAGWPWISDENKANSSVAITDSARWPGWAPCWRHEDFPYLTVSEMVDFAAGVRVTARHCFMLEALSVHVRPAVSVRDTPPALADPEDGGDPGSGKKSGKRRSGRERAPSMRSRELCFPDDMWSELLARGHIAGDERWVVGEDDKGRITVVRF